MKVNVSYFSNMKFDIEEDNKWEVEEEEMAKSLARALKAIRNVERYSLKTVSEKTDIPFQTIARYENGENIPSIIQAYKLAYFYQIPINDMFLIGLFNTDKLEEIIENWNEETTKKLNEIKTKQKSYNIHHNKTVNVY